MYGVMVPLHKSDPHKKKEKCCQNYIESGYKMKSTFIAARWYVRYGTQNTSQV